MTVSTLSGVLIQGPCIHHAGDGVPVISHGEVAALDVEWLECDTSGWKHAADKADDTPGAHAWAIIKRWNS